MASPHRVLIVGGGFAGLHAAKELGKDPRVDVTRWAYRSVTRGRSTRLITGSPLLPPIERPEPPAQGRQPARSPAEAASRMAGCWHAATASKSRSTD